MCGVRVRVRVCYNNTEPPSSSWLKENTHLHFCLNIINTLFFPTVFPVILLPIFVLFISITKVTGFIPDWYLNHRIYKTYAYLCLRTHELIHSISKVFLLLWWLWWSTCWSEMPWWRQVSVGTTVSDFMLFGQLTILSVFFSCDRTSARSCLKTELDWRGSYSDPLPAQGGSS